jgi:hypothetical protein
MLVLLVLLIVKHPFDGLKDPEMVGFRDQLTIF